MRSGVPLRGATASSLPSLLPAGQSSLSTPMQIIILMTLLTLLPAIIMSITPFLRISIVLHFLRQALGTQSAPSNQVLTGLALFLTLVSDAAARHRRSTKRPGSRWSAARSRRRRHGMPAQSR